MQHRVTATPELLGASVVTLAQRQLRLISRSLAVLSPRMLARCSVRELRRLHDVPDWIEGRGVLPAPSPYSICT